MKNRSLRNMGKIRSLADLKLEKAKLETDILKKETEIREDYRKLIDRLTLRNVFRTFRENVEMTSNVTSKVISVGKKIFAKRKKKKKNRNVRVQPPPEATGNVIEPGS